jgi:hypothetical protein
MGTNFYWVGHQRSETIYHHIGKRSAAGRYCYDCGSTFNRDGTTEVHSGSLGDRFGWDTVCPCCGKSPDDTTKQYDPVMVELGFQKPCDIKPAGISGASSFTWTMMKHKWVLEKRIGWKRSQVVDEYGKKYTAKEFLDMIERTCPIQFQLPQHGWS